MSIEHILDKAQSVDPTDEAFAELLAQSERAFANYAKTLGEIERGMIGMYLNVPPKFADWIQYRVGLRALGSTQALKHLLTQQGWVPSPRGVVQSGMEPFDGADGSNAEYVMAPQSVYRRQKAIEKAAVEKRSMQEALSKMDGLSTELERLGVGLDEFEVKPGMAPLAEVADAASENRARLRNKRP